MKTKIYGHRGVKGEYPENTMLGFKKALELGVDGLEIDVHLTKDGELVIIHDELLERTTTGEGWVKDATLSEIKAYSVGAKFETFPKYERSWDLEKVPTLSELLDLLKPTNVELNIELKTYKCLYPGIEEKVLELVKAYGMEDRIIYSSFHLPTMRRLQKLDPTAKVAWLLAQPISNPGDYLKEMELEALHLHEDLLTKMPETWAGLYHKIRVWTVNDKEQMEKLKALGVEAIITDFPNCG